MTKELLQNSITLIMDSRGENVALARSMVAALASQLETITVNELEEIKVAVSEAVSNAVIHGYEGRRDQKVTIAADLLADGILITISDQGVGIEDVKKAMEPSYSTDPNGWDWALLLCSLFLTVLEVESAKNQGTTVKAF